MNVDVVGCLACDLMHGRAPLPGGIVQATGLWRVEHCVGPLGVGTLLVVPVRHVESVAELTSEESAELGPLLRRTADVVDTLVGPEQVYVCLWSHAGRRRGHVHFVVQPVTTELVETNGGAYGPALQTAMFERGELPEASAVETFCDRARELLNTD